MLLSKAVKIRLPVSDRCSCCGFGHLFSLLPCVLLLARQAPVLRKPLKESYLPFWVGQAAVEVFLRGGEVGKDKLVTR
jgi:hypothetical protein